MALMFADRTADRLLRRRATASTSICSRAARASATSARPLTSLIYASFTFLLFSIEASILSVALQMLFGMPLALAHVISSLVVIPIALYGISLISRMQLADAAALAGAAVPAARLHRTQAARPTCPAWPHYGGAQGGSGGQSICCCSAWPPRCCCRCCRRSASRSTTCASCRLHDRGNRLQLVDRAADHGSRLGAASAASSCSPAPSWRCWRCAHGLSLVDGEPADADVLRRLPRRRSARRPWRWC